MPNRLIHETIRRLINAMVTDLIGETEARISAAEPHSAEEVRLAAFGSEGKNVSC